MEKAEKQMSKDMGKYSQLFKRLRSQQGATAIIVGLMMVVFIGFVALAVDIGHLYVVRNELQNASDAGALAGARFLYNNSGTAVNTGSNQIAYDTATANRSEKVSVDVHWTGGNEGDVQRGHWSFATKTFTPNDSTMPVDLWDTTTAELDANTNFINAVRVVSRREDTPAASFFARIFGHENFSLSTEAIAYIGFAGDLKLEEVDQPIAICKQSLLDSEGKYTCGVGRMINSGSNIGHQTGGWTNYSQPCETASASSVRPLVCGNGNPGPITLGQGMGTTGGMIQDAFNDLYRCWKNAGLDTDGDGWPDKSWSLTLPVIECPSNNTGNCSVVVGAVELKIIWITQTDKNKYKEVPRKMDEWSCPSTKTGQECWRDFRNLFHLKDVLNNADATYEDKTIYFLPDCQPHVPAGESGGEDFGILAKIPVLVR